MTTIDKILEEIGKHRFFKFKNDSSVILDSKTGLLWSPYQEFKGSDAKPPENIDGLTGWRLPNNNELREVIGVCVPSIKYKKYVVFDDGEEIQYLDRGYKARNAPSEYNYIYYILFRHFNGKRFFNANQYFNLVFN